MQILVLDWTYKENMLAMLLANSFPRNHKAKEIEGDEKHTEKRFRGRDR